MRSHPLNVRLIAACVGVIVFVVLAIYAAWYDMWPLFFLSCLLTALSGGYAIVVGELLHRGQ
jgi:hypothetical protein